MTYMWKTVIILLMLSAITHLLPCLGAWVDYVSIEDYYHRVNAQYELIFVSLFKYLG